MSYLSGELSASLSILEWTQTQLAERSGIAAPQINRYVRGINRLPPDTFHKLVVSFPVEFHARLLVAYLRDCIPAELADAVRVEPADESLRVRESAPRLLLPGIDDEMDRMLRKYAEIGMRHTEVRDMLKAYLRGMRLWPKDAE